MKPLSASELQLWRKDKGEYMARYITGVPDVPNKDMELGSLVHQAIETDTYPWLKEMTEKNYPYTTVKAVRKILDNPKLRDGEPEVVMRAKTASGIPLIAILDRFNKNKRTLQEYKTTKNAKRWNQHAVDVNFQLSFYAYIYHILYHAYFSEMSLHQLNIMTGTVTTFKTVRSKTDIETMDRLIHYSVAEMKEAGVWEKRLTKEQRLTRDHQLQTL